MPCRLIPRMSCFKQQNGVSAGQVIGIQSFSDDPLLEGFDPSQFNQLLPQGEFKLIIGDNLARKIRFSSGAIKFA